MRLEATPRSGRDAHLYNHQATITAALAAKGPQNALVAAEPTPGPAHQPRTRHLDPSSQMRARALAPAGEAASQVRQVYTVGEGSKTIPLHVPEGARVSVLSAVRKESHDDVPLKHIPQVVDANGTTGVRMGLPAEDAVFQLSISVRSVDGTESVRTLEIVHSAQNDAPGVNLPADQHWSQSSIQKIIEVGLSDENKAGLKVSYSGTFVPAGPYDEAQSFDVRTNDDGNILFRTSGNGPENRPGTYHINVKAEDVHGVASEASMFVRVTPEVQAPSVTFAETAPATAPEHPSVRTITAKIADADGPLSELTIEATATSRAADTSGRLVPTTISLNPVLASDGTFTVHVPVPGKVYSDTTVDVKVTDLSGHTVSSSTVLSMRPEEGAPRVNLGAAQRTIAQSAEPVEILIDVSDADGDTFEVSASATDANGSTIPAEVVRREGRYFLQVTPKNLGSFDVAVTATETVSGKAASTANTTVHVKPEDQVFARSYIWTEGTNEFSSKGQTKLVELPGIAPGARELRANEIHVTGLTRFEEGRDATDVRGTKTSTHDAFAQSVVYHSLAETREKFNSLGLGMTWKDVAGAKTGQEELRVHVNSITDVNAYYRPDNEELNFGTSDGKWSLAADGDVVIHEAGHWMLDHLAPGLVGRQGDAGPIHEGYGDAQASLMLRDPEMSEDFGKILGEEGKALRNVNNSLKISDTRAPSWFSGPHDRGRVFGGMMWSIGEHLHQQLTGRRRSREVDAEKLDQGAADLSLKILWTFPLYLGTKAPSRVDFTRSILTAIDELEEGGHFPENVDLQKLRNFVLLEASKRELLTPSRSARGRNPFERARSLAPNHSVGAAITSGLREAGLDPTGLEVQRDSMFKTPSGRTISRFNITKRVQLRDGSVDALVHDDHLTVIGSKDGTFEAQLGSLPSIRDAAASADANVVTFGHNGVLEFTAADVAEKLQSYAEGNLSGRGLRAAERGSREEHLTQQSLHALHSEDSNVELRWFEGKLTAWLHLAGQAFSAEVTKDGSLVGYKRHKLHTEG